ncbi:MAG: bifunctional glutamate N-acetyltransferase/amino-acid acetyltransferase ArgJ [Pseudomonadales bacterium]|nr:bifunctional glutamate N-acetyltransferase/amino-acid acetyltransferase ArgJ [Pseudomonadales bacterium]
MAVGENKQLKLEPVPGLKVGTAEAGIKKPNRKDVVIFELCEGSVMAGAFTRNRFCAAPVQLAQSHLALKPSPRYLLINTGNANAGTGEQGMQNALRSCQAVAEKMSCGFEQVYPFSTGVIGEQLPMAKLEAGINAGLGQLGESSWEDAASGIMTTDTRPKGASKQLSIDGKTITLTGISKGAGMIKPNMATMLAFIATDALIPRNLLQKLHSELVKNSFNRITIDGDTSTNDCCMLMATGQSGVLIDEKSVKTLSILKQALEGIYLQLAHAIVLDAEGATKFITITVQGGANEDECLEVAYTIAHSPLVKTAFFASDPNWGRILAAIGRAQVDELDVALISVFLGDVCIVKQGGVNPEYSEHQGEAVMVQENITVRVELGRGDTQATVWTSDLSHEYVRINAEYRT